MIIHFVTGGGVSNVFLGVIVIVQIAQGLSNVVEPALSVFAGGQLWLNLGLVTQALSFCPATILDITPSPLLFPIIMFLIPGFVIAFAVFFECLDRYFNQTTDQIRLRLHILVNIACNLLLFVTLLTPYILFEQFTHVLFCFIDTSAYGDLGPPCLDCEFTSLLGRLHCPQRPCRCRHGLPH